MANEITSDEQEAPGDAGITSAPAAAARNLPTDLSQEIAKSIARRPGEQVTCRRVGDHHYRCNRI